MVRGTGILMFFIFTNLKLFAQKDTVQWNKHYVTMTPVVVGAKVDASAFIQKIQNDSSFYKAFKNLRILGYTAINDIRMLDKKGGNKGFLHSKTMQHRQQHCRTMEVIEEQHGGDIYDDKGRFNYYTAAMYASLFFTSGKVCNENNIVTNEGFTADGLSGIDKHKIQLKKLFFNPGQRIEGLPMISGKTAIFEDRLLDKYDLVIDQEIFQGKECLVFYQKVNPAFKDEVVIDEMKTWFDATSNEVLARNYSLSYEAGLYDFNVRMEVEMTHANGWLVPSLIRYVGDWKVMFKKRERGVFTATLFNFNTGDH